jgi:hypothetical protein
MKFLFITLIFVTLSLTSWEMLASGLAQKSPGDPAALQAQFGGMNISASEFIALTPKEIAKKTSEKMSWDERILLKIAQKRIKKQLAKGVQPPPTESKEGSSNKMGKISVILGGAGLLLLFSIVEVLVILGLICVGAGLVFGIIGLVKDEKKTMAIIGTALPVIAFVALIIVIAAVY